MDGQPASPARAAVDVIAVTQQDEFLLELGQALGGQASVSPTESATQALEQLSQTKRLQILVIDSRGVADVRADVDAVQARAPHVQILVFAEQADEQAVAAALKGSTVFAVLPVPVDAPKTAAVFGGAVAEAKSRQTAPAPRAPQKSAPIVVEAVAPAALEPIPPPRNDGGENRFTPRVMIGIALAVVGVAVGVWLLTRGDSPRSAAQAGKSAPAQSADPSRAPAEEAAPSIETSLVRGKVDELLEKARLAMRERRYTEPAGDNALLYYRSAAYADPASGEALDGLNRVGTVIAGRFEEALSASRADEAAVTLAQFKSALPKDARVAEFQSRLSTLRAQIARKQEEERQKRLAAEEKAAREAAAAEQKRARAAAATAEAERKAQLAREREREEKLKSEQAAKAVTDAAKATPGAASGRSAASLQASLKRKRYVPPEYPQDALAKGIGGVVTVSFTVDVNGEPRDIQVDSSEPAGVFDRAAIAAVRRWRYEPLVIDGVPTEVPARTAIRFAPPE